MDNSTKQWVSSRLHLKTRIEDEFKASSRTLQELSQSQQKKYVQERLNLEAIELENLLSKLEKNVIFLYNSNILGTPLHIYLLTEVLIHNQISSDAEDVQFTLDKIYETFIDDKIKYYFTHKLGYKFNLSRIRKRTDQKSTELKNFYKKISMIKQFDHNFLKKLNIKYDDEILQTIQTNGDERGFIANVHNNSTVQFVHHSIGEFFTAQYLSENWTEIKHFKSILFKEKYNYIRFLFDLIMARNCKAHVAALYKNWNFLSNCINEEILKIDNAGRNIVQILGSWGPSISQINACKFNTRFEIIIDNVKNSTTEGFVSLLENLCSKIKLHEKDKLFNLNSFSYASKAESFLALGVLSAKSDNNKALLKFKKYYSVVIYYCLLFDYAEILHLLDKVPFLKSKFEFYCFEHLLALYNCVNWIRNINNTKKFKIMLKFDMRAGDGNQPLHCVFLNNNVSTKKKDMYEIVKLFLQQGANLNAQNMLMQTPLHLAVICKCNEIVKLLLENNVETSLVDMLGNTSSDYAQPNSILYDIVKVNTKEKSKNKSKHLQKFQLYKACIEDNYQYVRKVICRKPFYINLNIGGKNLIERAYDAKSLKVVELLLQKNVDFNDVNFFKQNFLHVACKESDTRMINILINCGINLDVYDYRNFCPIHYAVYNGDLKAVELLLHNNAKVDVATCFGNTLLHIASTSNSCQKVFLSNSKISLEIRNIAEDSVKIVKLLLEKNANPNLQNVMQQTPLHSACIAKNARQAKLLLEKNADPNVTDSLQNTALHYCCRNNSFELTELLLNHNADVNIISFNGKTPLHYACKKGNKDIVLLLLSKGADANICDLHCMRPVDYATLFGNDDIVHCVSASLLLLKFVKMFFKC